MTASSLDAMSRAVVELARRDNILSWEAINGKLNADNFSSARIENARNSLQRLYLQAHHEYAESLVRGQPLSPISIPETPALNAAVHLDNSPSQLSTGAHGLVSVVTLIWICKHGRSVS